MNQNYLPEVENYLLRKVPIKRAPLFLRMEKHAEENMIPIIPMETAKLLDQLVMIKKPDNILEIGTAIGYSALWLARSFKGRGYIYTIEFSELGVKVAAENFKKYDKKKKIKLIHGSATPTIAKDKRKYDLIFIDAKKNEYPDFFRVCLPRLNKGGMIILDNLFWHGQVIGIKEKSARFQKAVKTLKKFNKKFIDNDQLESVILPIGDGLGIGVKK